MDWKKIIMDGIYVALIGVGGIIIGTLLQEFLFGGKNFKRINEHDVNSKSDHMKLLNVAEENKKDILAAEEANRKEILAANTVVKDILIQATTKDRMEYDNLNEKQKEIVDSVRKIEGLPQEIMRLNSEVLQLKDVAKSLKLENGRLKEENSKLKEMNKSLRNNRKIDER